MKKYLRLFLIGIPLVLTIFLLVNLKVKEVTCTNQFGSFCSQEIEDELKTVLGERLFLAKKKVRKSLAGHGLVLDLSVSYKVPDKIAVFIIERHARFAVYSREKNVYFLVGDDGVVVEIVDASALPRVKVDSVGQGIGERLADEVVFSLKIMAKLFSLYQVKEGELALDSLTVLYQGRQVIFPLEGDPETLVAALSQIVSRLNGTGETPRIEEVETVSVIDLRYRNPVLR